MGWAFSRKQFFFAEIKSGILLQNVSSFVNRLYWEGAGGLGVWSPLLHATPSFGGGGGVILYVNL